MRAGREGNIGGGNLRPMGENDIIEEEGGVRRLGFLRERVNGG
jgi:hypothetical protein